MNTAEVELLIGQKNIIYTERAHLIAWLSKIYPSYKAMDYEMDTSYGGLIVINSPQGQLSWHVSTTDLYLFDHLEFNVEHVWDGHTSAEKYNRIRKISVKSFDIKQIYINWMDWFANGVHNSSDKTVTDLLTDLTIATKAILDFMGVTDGALSYYSGYNSKQLVDK